ncbi:MAG: FAD-dependent oxidoreductase [Cyclobacteriaceae bacterium]|nr:FAD-dependent oxidoreductase [Cyclobacteriaceae bacterium]
MKNIVIIGNGISGITAARNIRKLSDHNITVISAETDHFFSRTALMYIYMGHMKYEHTKPYEDWFWKKNKINLVRDFVTSIDTDHKKLLLKDIGEMEYDILILGVGSKPNKFGWPGQDLKGVQGMYSYQDLENMEVYTENIDHAVIVGGGLIGIEMAEMLLSRNISITFLVRENSFWNIVLPPEESEMISRHIREHHVDLRLGTELKEIVSDDNGRARAIITNEGEEIACGFVGLTAGVSPNIDFLKESKIDTQRGIMVNEYFETNVPDVYAIGDCAQFETPLPGRRPIEQVWYTGRMHGETLAQTICGKKTAYNPGPWFNSAKFLDIEYQVYGDIKSPISETEEHIYWEHENGKHAIRIAYDKSTTRLIGINLMGVRYRHEVCDRWLKDGTKLKDVIRNLKKANFDPEFYKEYEDEILNIYNSKFPDDQVKSTSKRGLFAVFTN